MGVIKVSDKDIQIIYGPSVSQVRDEVSLQCLFKVNIKRQY